MGCIVEPAHIHTERPYNPCGYRVSSYLWLRYNSGEKTTAEVPGCGVDITVYLAGHSVCI